MTTLISWLGVDDRGPASVYIASDSRVSWGKDEKWDRARKVFASRSYPEVFGYCGNAYFPSQLLGQAIDLIDRGLIYDPSLEPTEKISALKEFMLKALFGYTHRQTLDFELVYASRTGSGMRARFAVHQLTFAKGCFIGDVKPLDLPDNSALLVKLGSGAPNMANLNSRWSASEVGGTSRAVFSAFCDAIQSSVDKHSGGPPQLVGIYRIGAARVFGIIADANRFVYGAQSLLPGDPEIEWRNTLFERCNPNTLETLPVAQRQPRPRTL